MSTRPRALILDFGEVLVHGQPEDTMRTMAARARVDEGAFGRAYWGERHRYDLDGRAGDFWRRVLVASRAPFGEGDLDRLTADLVALDVASWTRYREAVWDIARAFRAAGGKTAILSNGIPEVMARVRATRPLEPVFDEVVISYEVGLAKPDRAIYELCLSRLGLLPRDALFVDDREENIAAAHAVGLLTLRFLGDESLPALRARALPPS
jgi:putative hydrolase of the HAD superfamily